MQLRKVSNPIVDSAGAPVQRGEAVNAASQTGSNLSRTAVHVPFEFGALALTGGTLTLLDQNPAAAANGPTDVVLVARATC